MQNESVPISQADADADTARQLTRALTMNIAGGVYDWENTLRELGLDLSLEPTRISTQEQMDRDWHEHEALMDSTKRKRRKKMKKHKLKKRRRLNRAKVKK